MRLKKQINIEIGKHIQIARERSKYTQEELSEIIGITPNHLSAIERGASGASLETIEKLHAVLGVSADFLFFGEKPTETFSDEIIEQINRVKPKYYPQVKKILSALLEVLAKQESDD